RWSAAGCGPSCTPTGGCRRSATRSGARCWRARCPRRSPPTACCRPSPAPDGRAWPLYVPVPGGQACPLYGCACPSYLTRHRRRLRSALVEGVEGFAVALLDGLALYLQAGRQLAGLHREVLRQDLELLDRGVAGLLGVDLVDRLLHLLAHPRVRAQLLRVGRQPIGLGPRLGDLHVEGDQRGAVITAVALDEHVRQVRARGLDPAFQVGRGHVLAAGGLDQLLLAVGDGEAAFLVQLADVAGVEPAVLQRLRRLLGQVVVAAHDAAPADEDLAVVGDADLRARQRLADRAELHVRRAVEEAARRGLGEAVALQDREPGAVEELGDLAGQRRGAGDEVADPAAEAGAELAEHQLVGDRVLDLGGQRDRGAGLARPGHPDAGLARPVEDLQLRAALALLGGGHRVVDLLEDTGGGGHHGGPERAQVVGDAVEPPVDRGRHADVDHHDLQQLAERVRQRQPEEVEVVVLDQAQLADRARRVQPVVVG